MKNTEWIPCKDRLPEIPKTRYCESYLVTTKSGFVMECPWYDGWNTCFDYDNEMPDRVNRVNELESDYIVAWMPLPDPYKEEENG